MPKEPVLIIEKVEKSFSKKTILKDINLSISAGEVVGIIGPNGGGKSTLLKLLAGLISPSEGKLELQGKSVVNRTTNAPANIGLVLAEPGFYPLLTGWENLTYFGVLFGLPEDEIRTMAAPLIEKLKLTEMDEKVSALSTGTRQKLSLVRALLLAPKVLLLDEPTANLDPLVSQMFFDEMRSRADEGLACVWVTHQLEAAEKICDRVIFVDKTVQREIDIAKLKKNDGKLFNVWKSIEDEKEERP